MRVVKTVSVREIKTAQDIKKVLCIGAGVIAADLAVQFTLYGREFIVYAPTAEEEPKLYKRIHEVVLPPLYEGGYVTKEQVEDALKKITYIYGDPSQVPEDIDLVTENVFEEYETKRSVWTQFAPYLPKHAILTTDVSMLYPSRYADACGAPERFLAMHFSLPPFNRNIMDILPLEKTDPAVVEIVKELAGEIGQNYVLLKKENPGYLANGMLMAAMEVAYTEYYNGVADYVDIDKAWMGIRKEKTGPFGITDAAGADAILRELKARGNLSKEILNILEERVAQGRLGVKSGEGFYKYPNPAYAEPDFIIPPSKVPYQK